MLLEFPLSICLHSTRAISNLSSDPACTVHSRLRTKEVHMFRSPFKKIPKKKMKEHASIFSPKPTGAGEMLDNENYT